MMLYSKEYKFEYFLPKDEEYIALVEDILGNDKFQSMENFIQHGTTTCLSHSISVSYMSYVYCKKHRLDAKSVARAGLLHDMFLYDWHDPSQGKSRYIHGFTHPMKALKNAEGEFVLNEKEKNSMLCHMWPLTVIPPKYKEGYVLLWFDKCCSIYETFGHLRAGLTEGSTF